MSEGNVRCFPSFLLSTFMSSIFIFLVASSSWDCLVNAACAQHARTCKATHTPCESKGNQNGVHISSVQAFLKHVRTCKATHRAPCESKDKQNGVYVSTHIVRTSFSNHRLCYKWKYDALLNYSRVVFYIIGAFPLYYTTHCLFFYKFVHWIWVMFDKMVPFSMFMYSIQLKCVL